MRWVEWMTRAFVSRLELTHPLVEIFPPLVCLDFFVILSRFFSLGLDAPFFFNGRDRGHIWHS